MTACHVCGFAEPTVLEQPGSPFCLVSSDGKPAAGEAQFLHCPLCGVTQKAVLPNCGISAFLAYENYAHPEKPHPRDQEIADLILDFSPPNGARILDIGCGRGHLLRLLNECGPDFRLSGSEYDGYCRESVLAIPGVEEFFIQKAYRGPYDVIVLSHVLEHIPDPISFLRSIVGHLAPSGHMLVAVPNLATNPLDLVVADHCTHFTGRTLTMVCESAGFAVESLSARIVPRELVAILSTDHVQQPMLHLDRMRTRLGALRSALELARWEGK